MDLHERLAPTRPALSVEHEAADPFAELKNAVHRLVISDLGAQLFNLERRSVSLRERVLAESAAISPRRAGSHGRARPDHDRARGRHVGHGPLERLLATTGSARSWSTGPPASGSNAAASSRRPRSGSRTSRICAASSTRSSPRWGAGRRVLADGRRAPPRRQPHQRRHPAALAERPARHDPQVRPQPPRIRGHEQPRDAQLRDGRVPRALRPGPTQHPRLRRYRHRQDHDAQRALGRDPRTRPDRDDRGLGRAAARSATHAAARVAPDEHRGRRRSLDPRPRPQQPAHASRSDHRRRGARQRGARHAPGDEHRSRRLALDRPRQLASRCARPGRDDGDDGRVRPAARGVRQQISSRST